MRRIWAARESGTAILVLLVLTGAWIREPRFLEPGSINSMLLWMPLLLIVAVGQMMVIVTRGIDVSVGSMLGLAGVSVGMIFRANPNLSVGLGLALGAGIGLVLGFINGALVAWLRVTPIIATLGTLSAFRGLVFIVSKGEQVDSNHLPEELTALAMNGPLHIGRVTVSWLLVIALLIAAAGALFLKQSRAGRDIFALGSNPEAALLRGVAVTRTTFVVYVITGALAGLAGVLYAARYGFVNPATAGYGFELTVIAAVVIGGTRVTGGAGSVLGVVLGCLLLAAISVALAALRIDATWQQLAYGAIILVALMLEGGLKKAFSRFSGVG